MSTVTGQGMLYGLQENYTKNVEYLVECHNKVATMVWNLCMLFQNGELFTTKN